MTLQGGERVVVHLRVVPLRPGSLHVHGVAWLLNGTAHGQAALRIPRPRPRKPGSSSKWVAAPLAGSAASPAMWGDLLGLPPPAPLL